MDEAVLDKVHLRFPGEIEHVFREDHFVKSLNQLRFGIALGTLLYALFGVLDALIFPQTRIQTWFVRYAVVCPVCALTFLFTYSRHFKNYMQLVVSFAVIVAGAGVIAMMVIVRSPINYFHFAGLLLIVMYTYTFSKLRFLYTAIAAWSLTVLYDVAILWILPVSPSVFLNDNFFHVAANLIGMFSCYNRELYERKYFIQTRTIRDMEEKKYSMEKEKIFRDLHDGIGNITTNIGLLTAVAQKQTAVTEIRKTLAVIADLSKESMTEIRNIMRSFDAAPKTWDMMASELRRQGNAMVEPHGIVFDIRTEIDDNHEEPGSFLWLNLFRIYKEALMNVMKHSRAATVRVNFAVTRSNLLLSVGDDGVGMMIGNKPGRGLANMKARAKEIGGQVDITSDQGTLVRLELPFSPHYTAA